MAKKIADGNSLSTWLGKIIDMCISLSILFWVENPDSSFLWLQSTWQKKQCWNSKNFFKTDFCRFGTSWRKRTRFFTNCRLRGARRLCSGGHVHQILRGRSKHHKCAWTKVAEPYPRGLCSLLAHAVCSDLALLRAPGLSSCFCQHLRVGEAKNPGPRRRHPGRQDVADLDNVQLIRPQTVAFGTHHWERFLKWLRTSLDEEAVQSIWIVPQLCGQFLAAYGRYWYGEGGALYAFRHLVVFAQRTYPAFRGHLQEAWNLVAKWEELEPVCHRRPIPSSMMRAMACLAVSWKWFNFAAVVLITFHACARPGEVLKAARRNLVLPQDIGEPDATMCFLKISKPKPGRRGLGRVQHARINDLEVCQFLSSDLRRK